MSDETTHARVGCGPVGAGLVGLLALCCAVLTIGSGLVVVFPGQFVGLVDRDDGEPDRLRAGLGADGTPTLTVDPAEPVGSASNPAALGATVEGDGVGVTVHGVTPAASIAGAAPESGYTFLILDVTIASTSDEAEEFGAFFWSAKDVVSDETFDDEKTVRPADALLAGSVAPGDGVRGNVLLLVKTDSRLLRIKYNTAIIRGENLYWLYDTAAPGLVGTPVVVATPVAASPPESARNLAHRPSLTVNQSTRLDLVSS